MPSLPATSPPPDLDVDYPASDGRPMGESGWHFRSTSSFYSVVKEHLAHTDAYVAGNMFLYYEQGNPQANRAPDCMVILGVGNHERRSFKTWVEGAVPSVIFEFASDETFDEDLHAKKDLYARLGVAEYFLFDPLGDCLDPRLQGFRLEGGTYVQLVPDADGGLISQVLGLRLIPMGILLRAIDLRTNRPLLTFAEKTAELARLVEQAERERQRAELARRRADLEQERADLERQWAGQDRQRAEQDRQRADALDAEIERLRTLLGREGQAGDQPAAGE
jgi:Uma2 family endonuclease